MKTTTIQLVVKTESGTDSFGNPTYTETTEDVSGVLVGQPSTDDLNTSYSLYGKKIDYVLGIPRGDSHDWHDVDVIVFDERFRTVGYPMTGIEENIPLKWTQNVKITRYG